MCAPENKMSTTKSKDLGGETPAFYLFLSAGTAYKTQRPNHTVIKTKCTSTSINTNNLYNGTGKTYLANQLLHHLLLLEGRPLTPNAVVTFNVDHKSSKVNMHTDSLHAGC